MAFFAANSTVKSPKSPLWIPSATGVAHPIVAEHPYPQWSDRRRSLELTSSIQPVAGQTDCCQLPRPTLLWNRQKGGWSKPEDLKQKTHTNQTSVYNSVYIYITYVIISFGYISYIPIHLPYSTILFLPSCRRFLQCSKELIILHLAWNIGTFIDHSLLSSFDAGGPGENQLDIPGAWRQVKGWLPFGKLTVCYWKWPFIVDFPIKNGDFP